MLMNGLPDDLSDHIRNVATSPGYDQYTKEMDGNLDLLVSETARLTHLYQTKAISTKELEEGVAVVTDAISGFDPEELVMLLIEAISRLVKAGPLIALSDGNAEKMAMIAKLHEQMETDE